MTREELEVEVTGCLAEFRAARAQVEVTELRLMHMFARASEDDQVWFVGRVMEMLGVLMRETAARDAERVGWWSAAGMPGPVH